MVPLSSPSTIADEAFYIFHKLWCSCLNKSPAMIGIVIFLIIKCISNSTSSSFSFLLQVNLLHTWHHITTWKNYCWLVACVQDWNNKFRPYKSSDDGRWYYRYSLLRLVGSGDRGFRLTSRQWKQDGLGQVEMGFFDERERERDYTFRHF